MRMISMAIRSLFITLFFLFASTLSGQTVKVYVSSKTGDRIAAKPDLQFSGPRSCSSPMPSPLAEQISRSMTR